MRGTELVSEEIQSGGSTIDPMALFMADLKDPAYQCLGKAQEQTLISKLNDPDPKARQEAKNRLTQANIGLVISQARRYTIAGQKLGFQFSDLIGEGTIGLMTAIDHYDPEKGCLSTYAVPRIRQAIGRALDNGGTVRHPAYIVTKCRSLNKTQTRLSQENQRPPTVLETAQELGLDPQKVEILLGLTNHGNRQVTSLDELFHSSTDDPRSRVDFLADPKPNPEEEVLRKEAENKALELFDGLPKRERQIMRLFIIAVLTGYASNVFPSPAQITAKSMGISRQCVEQIMNRAKKRLKTNPILEKKMAELYELLTT